MITIFPLFYSGTTPQNKLIVIIRVLVLLISAFFCGPIFSHLPPSLFFWQQFGPLFASFLSLFLLWELVLLYISRFVIRSKTRNRWISVLKFVPAFALSILTFYWLGHFESKISEPVFFVVLGLLGLRAIAHGLYLNELTKPALIFLFIYIISIANLSAYLITEQLSWQFPLLSLALISGLLSQSLLSYSLQNRESVLRYRTAILRLNIFLLLAGPVIVLAFVYLGLLDKKYLLVLFSLAFSAHAAEKSRQLEKAETEAYSVLLLNIEQLSCYSSILFVFTLISVLFVQI